MPRKRLISPEFFTHSDLYDAEARFGLPLRLAFAGLWTASDRRGLFRWRPRELKLAILPYDPVDFGTVLDALASAGFVVRYVVDGKEYGRIPSFAEWQTFHPHEKPADIPEPTNVGPGPDNVGTEQSVTVTSTVTVTDTGVGADAPVVRIPRVGVVRSDVDAVLAHYVSRHHHRRPGEKDRKLVGRHLVTYSVAELCEAIDGNADDRWAKDTGKHELAWTLRDNGQIDTYRAKAQRAGTPATDDAPRVLRATEMILG